MPEPSNYWNWCRSATDTYTDGTSKYAQDWTLGPWTLVANEDLAFQAYWGAGESRATSLVVTGTVRADSITTSSITGDAYYQTISGSTVSGSTFPGSPTPPDVASPLSSATIAKWKADATAGGTYSGEYRISGGTQSFGPKLINGNLRLDPGSTLNVTGTLYVTDQIRIEDSTVKCAPAYGANSCVIYSENWDRIKGASVFAGSGTAGSHLVLGTNATGTIQIEDNPTGLVFLAKGGTVNPIGSAVFKSIYAKGVTLGGTSRVVYDATLASMNIAASTVSGSSSYWGVSRWNTR